VDISSLPNFPPPLPILSDVTPPPRVPRVSRRHIRAFINSAKFAMIVAVLVWSRQAAADIEKARAVERSKEAVPARPPLDFRLIMERFDSVKKGSTRRAVEELLGPPSRSYMWGPEVAEFELDWSNYGRNIIPAVREWNRWEDPNDPNRWVAIFYTKWPERPLAVTGMLKEGF
jgi:hypothetical protein